MPVHGDSDLLLVRGLPQLNTQQGGFACCLDAELALAPPEEAYTYL